jgi:GNAT superfamily N-acetyltransferase
MRYTFRQAESEADFDSLRRLNHLIFAEELHQHAAREDRLLVDRMERRSRYWIALAGDEVVGMVSVHDEPPFSVEQRLSDPAVLAALPGRKLEVRLLAVHPQHRGGLVVAGLLGPMIAWALTEGYELLLISGVEERAPMYRRLGFRELGPAVPDGGAAFYPMVLRLAELPGSILISIARYQRRGVR